MDPFSFALALFQALAAIPTLTSFVERFAAGVSAWSIAQTKKGDEAAIIDAVSAALKAESQEDRYAALSSWRTLWSRPRVSQ